MGLMTRKAGRLLELVLVEEVAARVVEDPRAEIADSSCPTGT